VIDAESQVVLYNLKEHDFQDVFKNGRSATTSRVMVASKSKLSF
jgi:RNase P protein component